MGTNSLRTSDFLEAEDFVDLFFFSGKNEQDLSRSLWAPVVQQLSWLLCLDLVSHQEGRWRWCQVPSILLLG